MSALSIFKLTYKYPICKILSSSIDFRELVTMKVWLLCAFLTLCTFAIHQLVEAVPVSTDDGKDGKHDKSRCFQSLFGSFTETKVEEALDSYKNPDIVGLPAPPVLQGGIISGFPPIENPYSSPFTPGVPLSFGEEKLVPLAPAPAMDTNLNNQYNLKLPEFSDKPGPNVPLSSYSNSPHYG